MTPLGYIYDGDVRCKYCAEERFDNPETGDQKDIEGYLPCALYFGEDVLGDIEQEGNFPAASCATCREVFYVDWTALGKWIERLADELAYWIGEGNIDLTASVVDDIWSATEIEAEARESVIVPQ